MGVRVCRSLAATALLAILLVPCGGASRAWAGAVQPAHEAPAQPPATPAPSAPAASEAAGHGEATEGHQGGLLQSIARLVNFGILAATLVYFLRSPAANYLSTRKTEIRSDLDKAHQMRIAASAQIAEIERRMTALPAELESLRREGAEEVAAEEARMRGAAEAERNRFLEQARRDIDAQLKVAERDLIRHAADLAVALATERIRNTITAADQTRLVDRYVNQVGQSGGMTS